MRFIHFGESSSQPIHPSVSRTASNHTGDQSLALFQAPETSNIYQVHPLSFSLCPVPDMSPFEENICITYTLEYLLSGASYDGKTPIRSHDWSDEPLANTCFLSLAMTYFGSQHREDRLLKKGLKLYGVALKELNKALANSYQCQTRGVLDSIVTMAFLEVIASQLGLARSSSQTRRRG